MSIQIESDHLMNLADGQLLYNDLRSRINVATVEETRAIINEYQRPEEDDGMLIETTWYEDPNTVWTKGWKTTVSADQIAAYFKAGKSIVFHMPYDEGARGFNLDADWYAILGEYRDAGEDGQGNPTTPCFGVTTGTYQTWENSPSQRPDLSGTAITEDGKLLITIYID